jgi:hypothetical protein
MENVVKQYPEFGFTVTYMPSSDFKIIDWEIRDESDELLMTGKFHSDNFYRSTFTLIPSNIEENVYENLFYTYFENIKLECIEFVEEGNGSSIFDEDENI